MDEKYLEGLCKWLSEHKGVKKIDLLALTEFVPEYEEYLEEQKPVWTSSEIKCDLCGHKHISVHHIESERLECPNCGNMTIF